VTEPYGQSGHDRDDGPTERDSLKVHRPGTNGASQAARPSCLCESECDRQAAGVDQRIDCRPASGPRNGIDRLLGVGGMLMHGET
jgi:hypothetical protein